LPVGAALAPGAVTEVWVPRRHFPDGYDVVDLQGAQVTSPSGSERLELVALPGAVAVSFGVVPPSCGAVPASGCRRQVVSNRGTFALTGATTKAKNRLLWSWVDGDATAPPADFGNPTTITSYRLCAYDETAGVSRLALSTGVAAAGTCGRLPCWRASSTGFHYRDPGAAVDGVRQVVLKAGTAGRSKIQVRGQGIKLALPTLPFGQDPTVTVQLRSSAGQCWEAAYSTPAQRNRVDQFKDRAE
jgi:hypothetical protein